MTSGEKLKADCIAMSHAASIEYGTLQERSRIVAWLREHAGENHVRNVEGKRVMVLAQIIENGGHV